MQTTLVFFRTLFKTLSVIAPKQASRLAWTMFQRPISKRIRKREEAFYREARHFVLKSKTPAVHGYEMGSPDGKLVLLVHGWESNAGSMYAIATELAEKGYRVISFDLPAHGYSKDSSTNLKICAEAMQTLIRAIQPQAPFSVIAHSLGSAVSTLALADQEWEIDQLIFLTAPNAIEAITEEFQDIMGFSDQVLKGFQSYIERLFERPLSEIVISQEAQKIDYQDFLMIHDRHDKVLPFENALAITASLPRAQLLPIEHAGHYRMLWEAEVIEHILTEMSSPRYASSSFSLN